jgi:hypothetical protein
MRSGLTRPLRQAIPKIPPSTRATSVTSYHFSSNARKTNLALTDLLGAIAKAKGMTPAQIAPAWLLVQKPCLEALPSRLQDLRPGKRPDLPRNSDNQFYSLSVVLRYMSCIRLR